MKLPIPNDWNGKDWVCVQVEWPDSPQWIGILSGLITSIMRGRLWDENTGVITDTQAIGEVIYGKNFPFNFCSDSGGDSGGTDSNDFVNFAMATCDAIEGGIDTMSLCGYNPKAFDIVDGVLFVRDFCGEWVEIGRVGSVNDEPADDTIIPDTPPTGYQDSTPCAKANKLAVMTHTIVNQAFAEIDAEEDPYDFYTDMRDFIPGIDLAFNDLMNMWFQLLPLEFAGYQAETISTDPIAWIACTFEPLIPDNGNAGISSDTYDDLRSAISDALRSAFPDTNLGLEKAQREVWKRAFWSIGAKDVEKMTYYAQPTPGQDCDCPTIAEPYTGLVWWENARTIQLESNGSDLFSVALNAINKISPTIQGPYADVFWEVNWLENLAAAGTIQELEIVTYDKQASNLGAFYPADAWTDTEPTPVGNYWKPVTQSPAPDNVVYSQPSQGVQKTIMTWDAPTNLNTAVVAFACKGNPKAGNVPGGGQAFRVYCEITYAGPLR